MNGVSKWGTDAAGLARVRKAERGEGQEMIYGPVEADMIFVICAWQTMQVRRRYRVQGTHRPSAAQYRQYLCRGGGGGSWAGRGKVRSMAIGEQQQGG
jgi:hypothetical protein